jgi:hypothetical protein
MYRACLVNQCTSCCDCFPFAFVLVFYLPVPMLESLCFFCVVFLLTETSLYALSHLPTGAVLAHCWPALLRRRCALPSCRCPNLSLHTSLPLPPSLPSGPYMHGMRFGECWDTSPPPSLLTLAQPTRAASSYVNHTTPARGSYFVGVVCVSMCFSTFMSTETRSGDPCITHTCMHTC